MERTPPPSPSPPPPPPPPLRPGASTDDGDQPPGARRHPRGLLGLRSPPHRVSANPASGTTLVPRDGGAGAASLPAMARPQNPIPSSSRASQAPPPASTDPSPSICSCEAPRRRCPPSDNLPSTSQAASTPPQDANDLHPMAPRRRCPPSDNLPSSQVASAPPQDANNLHPMGFHNLNWNGPGLHRFDGLENLLLSVGDLNRFFSRRESLCILQNALYFVNHEIVNDASDDPCRRDFEFLVVSRRSFLEMADRAGVVGKSWPGYKEKYYEMSEERRISTLKLNENTFLWRHEVSGKLLLRRRISLDKDEGPFEDESQVFYILQYQKLPRMKKAEKAKILAERAERGHF